MEERRCKVLWISQSEMAHVMGNWLMNRFIMVPDGPGLPPGCKLAGDPCYSWSRRAFGFRLEHPDFEPVQDGRECPEIMSDFLRAFTTLQIVDVENGVGKAVPVEFTRLVLSDVPHATSSWVGDPSRIRPALKEAAKRIREDTGYQPERNPFEG